MDFSLLAKYADARQSVLFASIGHAGQLNPLLAIAQAFQRQCPHISVTFATSVGFQSVIEGAGLHYLPVWGFSKLPQDMLDQFNESGIRNVELMTRYARWTRTEEVYTHPRKVLVNWITDHQPCLVISDVISEAGMAAAIDTNTRFVINSPCPPYTSFPESLPAIFPPVGSGTSLYKTSIWHRLYDLGAGARYGLGLVKEILPFLKEQEALGNPRPETLADKSVLFLNATSEKLSDPRVKWPRDKLKWIGASLDDEFSSLANEKHFNEAWKTATKADATGLYSWMDDASSSGKPIVFLSLGTIYKLDEARVSAIYDALSSLPVKVLWKLGQHEQQFLTQEAKQNYDFHIETWIPSPPLIMAHPSVKLFVNHGGGNSLHEGLFFGKPMVCLPAWMDCFDFAMRCQDAGAGLAITTAPRLDKTQFKNAVQRVLLDPGCESFTTKAQEVASDLRALGGATKAATELKGLLERRATLPLPKVEQITSQTGSTLQVMTLPPC